MVNSPWLFPINMALYIPKQQFFAWEDLMTNLWTYRFYQSKIGIIGSWRVLLAAQDGSPLVNIQKTMENHHFQWENPLFLWSFSIVFLCLPELHRFSSFPSPTLFDTLKNHPIHTSLGDPLGSFGHIGAIGLGKNWVRNFPGVGKNARKTMQLSFIVPHLWQKIKVQNLESVFWCQLQILLPSFASSGERLRKISLGMVENLNSSPFLVRLWFMVCIYHNYWERWLDRKQLMGFSLTEWYQKNIRGIASFPQKNPIILGFFHGKKTLIFGYPHKKSQVVISPY